MSRSSIQVSLLILSYSALAVVWGWRLHANDTAPCEATSPLETTLTAVAASLAHAPEDLQKAALLQLTVLPDHELQALQVWQKSLPEQRVRQLTVQNGPVHAPSVLNVALLFTELARADAPAIDECRLLVSASGDRLEEPHKIAALEFLGNQAIFRHELSLAVEIHERACESPAATWQTVLNLTEAARIARRPAVAQRVINAWLHEPRGRLSESQREDALDLQVTLLLEGTRYAEASRITLDALRSLQPKDAVPARLMQRALLATRAAGESAELLPWIERMLRTYADHHRSLQELATAKTRSADYRHWLNEGACIADLSHQTSIACELFFRLAALGETQVLARLHALATQIGRGEELAQVLKSLQTRLSPVRVAQALVDGDAPAAARELLANHLKVSAADREAWRLLTQIDITLRGAPSATTLWESFLKRFPGDSPALQELAQLQFAAEQYPQALRTLQSISSESLDKTLLRRITELAIQLDDIPAAHRTQKLIVESAAHPAVSEVLTLTRMGQQHPDAIAAEAAQNDAVAKLPAGTAFHKALALQSEASEATSFSTAAQAK